MIDKWTEMAAIDAARTDPGAPEAEGISVYMACPVTPAMRYPETCAVDVDPGRYPDWLRQLSGSWRRPATAEDYGFYTASYQWAGLTVYVANEPGDGPYLYRRILKAAREAGWEVSEWGTEWARFDAWRPE